MKKITALILALVMIVAAFAACGEGGDKKPADTGKQTSGGSGDTAISTGGDDRPYGGIFKTSFLTSVTTLNTLTTGDTYPAELAGYCTTKLYMSYINEDKQTYSYYPMLASDKPEQVDDEGLVWRIPLRKDYKWANGDLMNTDTVIYTWKMILDPYMLNLVSYMTNNAYVRIKNVAEYQQQAALGIEVPWEDVGIKKIDDYTIEVTLTRATNETEVMRFFTGGSMIHEATFEKGMSADRTSTVYGTNLDNWVSSGPFIMTGWVTDSKYTFEKNPDYVYADLIHYDGVEIRVVPDANTALEMFLKGDLDEASITYSQWEEYEDDPRVFEYWNDSTMYLYINTGNPNFNNFLGNVNFRKAIFYGVDRVDLASTLGGYPYSRIYRRSIQGDPNRGIAFVDMPGADYVEDPYSLYRPQVANQYLDKAFEETGQANVSFEIYYKEDGTHTRGATEIMQRQMTKNLEGVNITIRAVPQAQAYTLRRWDPDNPTSFDFNIGSLLPSEEPLETVKFYASSYKPNRFYWNNLDNLARFDELYNEALGSLTDNDKLISLCQQMEKILLVDECIQVPLYEVPTRELFSEHIQLPVDHYVNGWGFGVKYGAFID